MMQLNLKPDFPVPKAWVSPLPLTYQSSIFRSELFGAGY